MLDGKEDLGQSFNLVTENLAWMSPSSGSAPALTELKTSVFNATVIAPPGGYFAAGAAGADTTVKVTVVNAGTAPWYPNEVVYIGTPPGTTSKFTAANWPKGPGGCRNCRAHRVSPLVAPGASYTFDLTLHIPAGTLPVPAPYQDLLPVADVPRVDTGLLESKPYMGAGQFRVTLVVVPKPLGYHEVTGYGLMGGTVPDLTPAPTTSSTLALGTFTCIAVADADALTTTVETCTVTVQHGDGTSESRSAGAATSSGSVAATGGTGLGYDPAAGDTAQVCWTASATFADGTTTRRTACSDAA